MWNLTPPGVKEMLRALLSGSQNPALLYCSFCDTGRGFGAIIFQPTGAASFSGAAVLPKGQGQQFTIQSAASPGDSRVVLLAIMARSGVIEVFDK